MASSRVVGELSCFEVLARLSDYLDGELDDAGRRQVEVHLRGCEECTRFGGEFGQVVSALKQRLGAEEDVPEGVAERLEQALRGH
jgi:anti-sigma factor (TIGR02949 family)